MAAARLSTVLEGLVRSFLNQLVSVLKRRSWKHQELISALEIG